MLVPMMLVLMLVVLVDVCLLLVQVEFHDRLTRVVFERDCRDAFLWLVACRLLIIRIQ
jgi:hypothetical protein